MRNCKYFNTLMIEPFCCGRFGVDQPCINRFDNYEKNSCCCYELDTDKKFITISDILNYENTK